MNQPESCRATDAPSADVLYAAVHILECPFGVDRPYHYYIPRPLADAVRPGAFVTVPFGKGNRKKLALAVEICDRAGLSALPDGLDPDKFKPVSGVCRARLFLTEGQLALCRYLTAQTLCTVGEAVRTLVPAQALCRRGSSDLRVHPRTGERVGAGIAHPLRDTRRRRAGYADRAGAGRA